MSYFLSFHCNKRKWKLFNLWFRRAFTENFNYRMMTRRTYKQFIYFAMSNWIKFVICMRHRSDRPQTSYLHFSLPMFLPLHFHSTLVKMQTKLNTNARRKINIWRELITTKSQVEAHSVLCCLVITFVQVYTKTSTVCLCVSKTRHMNST